MYSKLASSLLYMYTLAMNKDNVIIHNTIQYYILVKDTYKNVWLVAWPPLQGKTHWAKLSRIPSNEAFHGKTFMVPYV